MKKIVIISLFLFLAASLCYGQLKKDLPNYGYKLMPLEALVNDGLIASQQLQKASKLAKVTDLPVVVDYTEFMPPVGDQYAGNTCTGFAVAYAIGEIRNKELGYSLDNQFSPSFIFNLSNVQNHGAMIVASLAVVEAGCASLEDFPYIPDQWQILPDHVILDEAVSDRVTDLEWFAIGNHLHRPQGDTSWPGYDGINRARALLAENKPVVMSMALTEGYGGAMAQENWIYSYQSFGHLPFSGGHALCIVGYNDTLATPDGMGAFKVINSWGADKFDNGYCWITYQMLALTNFSNNFYTFTMLPDGYRPKLRADFHLNNFLNLERLDIGLKANGLEHTQWLWSYRWRNKTRRQGVELVKQPVPDFPVVDLTDFMQYVDTIGENTLFISGGFNASLFDGIFPEIISFRLVSDDLGIDTLINANITITDSVFYAEWKFRTGNITDVENIDGVPSEFSLSQNYPNPFNPSTTIDFSVVERGIVTLKVYNLLGQEVALLVNEEKTAGHYNVQFNASQLASGMYVYRLQTENFTSTKKMILMK